MKLYITFLNSTFVRISAILSLLGTQTSVNSLVSIFLTKQCYTSMYFAFLQPQQVFIISIVLLLSINNVTSLFQESDASSKKNNNYITCQTAQETAIVKNAKIRLYFIFLFFSVSFNLCYFQNQGQRSVRCYRLLSHCHIITCYDGKQQKVLEGVMSYYCCSNHSLEWHLQYADFSKALSRLSSSGDYKRTQQGALTALLLYLYKYNMVHATTMCLSHVLLLIHYASTSRPPYHIHVP